MTLIWPAILPAVITHTVLQVATLSFCFVNIERK